MPSADCGFFQFFKPATTKHITMIPTHSEMLRATNFLGLVFGPLASDGKCGLLPFV
jgi:hypothetical protein